VFLRPLDWETFAEKFLASLFFMSVMLVGMEVTKVFGGHLEVTTKLLVSILLCCTGEAERLFDACGWPVFTNCGSFLKVVIYDGVSYFNGSLVGGKRRSVCCL
jgi:hypothetical protein